MKPDDTTREAIRFRLLALYHNCHSGAAFARCDAEATDDHAQKRVHWHEAVVYETCAGWINSALDTLPNAEGHGRTVARTVQPIVRPSDSL